MRTRREELRVIELEPRHARTLYLGLVGDYTAVNIRRR